MSDPKCSFPPLRRSASADAALRVELERVKQMTIRERITAALTIRERFSWISQVSKGR